MYVLDFPGSDLLIVGIEFPAFGIDEAVADVRPQRRKH